MTLFHGDVRDICLLSNYSSLIFSARGHPRNVQCSGIDYRNARNNGDKHNFGRVCNIASGRTGTTWLPICHMIRWLSDGIGLIILLVQETLAQAYLLEIAPWCYGLSVNTPLNTVIQHEIRCPAGCEWFTQHTGGHKVPVNHRLLHSPSLLAVGLSVDMRHGRLVSCLVNWNIHSDTCRSQCILDKLQCIVNLCNQRKFPLFFMGHLQCFA